MSVAGDTVKQNLLCWVRIKSLRFYLTFRISDKTFQKARDGGNGAVMENHMGFHQSNMTDKSNYT